LLKLSSQEGKKGGNNQTEAVHAIWKTAPPTIKCAKNIVRNKMRRDFLTKKDRILIQGENWKNITRLGAREKCRKRGKDGAQKEMNTLFQLRGQ